MKSTDLTWFLNSLADDLHDQELERDGYELDFYWDTADVQVALLGVPEFYDFGRTFRREVFRSDETLVASLAAAGWLGTIRMMQPHQSELLRKIQSGFGSKGDLLPPGGLTQFVTDAGLNIKPKLDVSALPRMSQDEVADLVNAQAGLAPTLFKVVQCARGNWKTRLAWWDKKAIIKFDDGKIDYHSVVSQREFAEIRHAFDDTRPHSRFNNFNDAVAICILAAQVREFSEGKQRRIPRFFVSSPLFMSVLARTGTASLLEYRFGDRTASVLRRPDYYWLRASLHPPAELPRTAQYERLLQSLSAIYGEVKKIVDARQPLDKAALDSLPILDPPLDRIVTDLRNFWFLENVWLPFAGRTALIEALREHVETARRLRYSDSFIQGVEQAIDRTKGELARNSAEFQWISTIVCDMDGAIARVLPHHRGAASVDFFRDTGVLRFGLPDELRSRIESLLEALLGGEDTAREDARNQIVMLNRNVKEENEGADHDAMVVAAGLWVLRMDSWLIGPDLLTGALQSRHPSLKMIATAAHLRARKGETNVRQALRDLEAEYEKAAEPAKKFDLAVGLGYLYFHWREWQKSRQRENPDELIDSAIRFAEAAAFDLPATSPEKKAYTLNQYLYYTCKRQQIPDADWEQMGQAADELVSMRGDDSVWQYRFDDTLAYYYQCLADLPNQPNRKRWLDTAIEVVELASAAARGDEEVLRHREELYLLSARLPWPRNSGTW